MGRPDELSRQAIVAFVTLEAELRPILPCLAAGEEVSGDTSTLEDSSLLDALRV